MKKLQLSPSSNGSTRFATRQASQLKGNPLMSRHSRLHFFRFLPVAGMVPLIVAASAVVAQPAQTRAVGVIEGIVTQTDNAVPVANALVTLSGGGIKAQSLEKLGEQLNVSTYMPQQLVTS